MAWARVAEKGAVADGAGIEVEHGGRRIAVFRQGGLYALDAMCVHQDQSIACGKIEDGVIECPHHFWHYDAKSGRLLDYLKDTGLQTYPAEERDDGIYVDV